MTQKLSSNYIDLKIKIFDKLIINLFMNLDINNRKSYNGYNNITNVLNINFGR